MQPWELFTRSLYLLKRWWILVMLAGIGSGATAFVLIRNQPEQYVASATLQVGNNLQSPNPNVNSTGVSQALAAYYADITERPKILDPVIDKLGLQISPDVMAEYMISTSIAPQSQLIVISVLDTNAERAATIANEIAQQLISFSPSQDKEFEKTRQTAQGLVLDLETAVKSLDQKIKKVNDDILKMTSAGEITEARTRLTQYEAEKADKQSAIEGLLGNLNDTLTNSLNVFQPASIPEFSLPQRTFPGAALATLLGMLIGLTAAWMLEELDDAWRGSRKTEMVIRETQIGLVPVDWAGLVNDASLKHPRGKSCIALRSELLLRLGGETKHSIMVTSAHATEERSRLAVDLARLFARSNQQVVLVDANLGEDHLVRTLGTEGDALRTLLRHPDNELAPLLQQAEKEHFHVLTGSTGGPSAHLVPTLHWPRAAAAIERGSDMAIFDGPPVLDSADATLLAPHVGGIVLVIDPVSERCSDTRRAIARLREVDAPLLGVVVLSYGRRPFWRGLRSGQRRVAAAG